ncbi:EAL domain-containing protein [Novacetimonas hansenii]|uniref:EAL domain-containing protein n=1 Tax=Novacetimonas hansenii TaxID=436 RepID=A0AAW5EUT0_NOVHA|nr:EAL domain-containing protein [Novacetimonas hansenii]MCJ8355035.1 EAL domain-containing protein [Novacetimonas hansenii]PYD72763.1 bifunctional diguanylate cyclase/phosphodiesterase [Novacetimonas hansenii]QOF96196.1 EAL domain-containing protein [Novacetimonas hansenii]
MSATGPHRLRKSQQVSTNVGVVIVDDDNAIVVFNDMAEHMSGHARDDVMGRHSSTVLPMEIQTPLSQSGEKATQPLRGGLHTLSITRRDGTCFNAELEVSSLQMQGRRLHVITLRDVSPAEGHVLGDGICATIVHETDRGILVLDGQSRIMHANPAFGILCGYSEDEVAGNDFSILFSGHGRDIRTLQQFRQQVGEGNSFEIDIQARRRDGTNIWLRAAATPVHDDHGALEQTIIILSDVSRDRDLRYLQQDVVEALASGLSLREVMDFICRRIERIVPDVQALVMMTEDGQVMHPIGRASLPKAVVAQYDGARIGPAAGSCGTAIHRHEEVIVPDIATSPLWAGLADVPLDHGLRACWARPIILRDGQVAGAFTLFSPTPGHPSTWCRRVVGACVHLCMLAIVQEHARQSIDRLAHYDGLTGLPNRAWLRHYCTQARQHSLARVIMVLNLDRFQKINEAMGHAAGDTLLMEVARRLRHALLPDDILTRTDGDEFVIVTETAPQQAAVQAERLLRILDAPLMIEQVELRPSASIGISISDGTDPSDEMKTVMKHAYSALSQAKEAGRNCYRFFSPEMNRAAEDRITLAAALRRAIREDRLSLVYQPQVMTGSRHLHGVEALARWIDPELGFISPGRFIPLAEETGQIEILGEWSLRTACRQMTSWMMHGIDIPIVSVNLSAIHFRDRNLPDTIARIMHETGMPPERLTIELTESTMIDNFEQTVEIVTAIRELGCGVSMDDFGTGFSSLSNLASLPVSEVKIDQSFMKGFEEPAGKVYSVVRAIVRIGQSLGMTVVAEGVETQAQYQLLRAMQCDVIQGYLFSRPLSPTDLAQWCITATPRNAQAVTCMNVPPAPRQAKAAQA